ncbi:phosphodiester glycosidase family protein [Streptomyces sp. NPDC050418]|uniref:phosphodiester glycosidase family protein n=1 Tax=Streptomyces sp. NPDC050418 TaxID=3365612 RepID=UPI003792AE22
MRTWSDGRKTRIHLLTIARDAAAQVAGLHGKHLATAETVRAMADRAGAVAAVNGTFFDIADGPDFGGYAGDPLGVYGTGGTLLSEASNGRTALVVGPAGSRPRITGVRTEARLRAASGAERELDGINRTPGRILGCGGVGGDRTSTGRGSGARPRHNQLCLDPDEIVRFTPEWGANSPRGQQGSTEAVLDGAGRVLTLRTPAGGPIPAGGSTLSAVGAGAGWLNSHARQGSLITLSSDATDLRGIELMGPGVSMIGGGSSLVADGRPAVSPAAHGNPPSALTHRDPRTLAGVRADGTLLLVVVDGRTAENTGASLQEAAALLADLGAQSAMNLDGGGSSAMVIDGTVVNRPMDKGGKRPAERPVATAIGVFD